MVRIFQRASDLRRYLDSYQTNEKQIGFAPTMGALHEGHLSLIQAIRAMGLVSVCSIFVNPRQFNDPADLEKYPRMPEADLGHLVDASCDIVFMPAVEEIFPPGPRHHVPLEWGILDTVMEGKFRPGHFQGMVDVVYRLLEIVRPQHLFMGQKDFQQLTIVRAMIRQLNLPVYLHMAPTVREADGLAMSSRNLRLSPDMRSKAPVIYHSLLSLRESAGLLPVEEAEHRAFDRIRDAGLNPEYVSVVDGDTLETIRDWERHPRIVACVAARAGDIRLIDNLILRWDASAHPAQV